MRYAALAKGFTLIELLIVVAILGILSAVIVPNLSTFLSRAPVFTTRVECAVLVVEEGVPKQVANVDLGEVRISLPRKMLVGRSTPASLTLVPNGAAASLTVTYSAVGIPEAYYEVCKGVRLYPIMGAELKAAGFAVSQEPSYAQLRAVSLDSPTVWQWTISPSSAGEHAIGFQLYALVRVEGYEGAVSTAVYAQSFPVSVSMPFTWTPVLTAIASLVGVAVGVLTVWRGLLPVLRRRRRGTKPVSGANPPETTVGPKGEPNGETSRRDEETPPDQAGDTGGTLGP